MATLGGARNLGRDDIGQLAPGLAADFVAWKVEGSLAFAGSGEESGVMDGCQCDEWAGGVALCLGRCQPSSGASPPVCNQCSNQPCLALGNITNALLASTNIVTCDQRRFEFDTVTDPVNWVL